MLNYRISAIINIVVSIACAIAVYQRNPNSRKSQYFVFYCLWVGLTYIFVLSWAYCTNATHALFLFRLIMMLTVIVPGLYLKKFLLMLDIDNPTYDRLLQWVFWFLAFYAPSAFTPLLIPGVRPRLDFPYWGIPGPLMIINVILYTAMCSLIFFQIWRERVAASPVYRNKLSWLIVASLFGWFGAGCNFPLYYGIPFHPNYNAAVSLYILIAASLFFNLGLLDIFIFLKGAIIYVGAALLTGILLGFFLALIVHDARIFPLVMAVCFLAPPIHVRLIPVIRKIINRLRFARRAQYLQTVDVSVEKLKETTYTYNDLAKNMVSSLLNTFPVEMAAVYLSDMSKADLQLRAQQGMKNPAAKDLLFNRSTLILPATDPIITYIGSRKDVIVSDVLENKTDITVEEKSVVQSLKRIEAEVCAPIISFGKVKGALVLSRKKNGQMFSLEDIQAIDSFARMAEEIMRYIIGMETELNHTALYSHDMNNDTKSLLQTIQFLRSPLAKSQPIEKIESLLKLTEDVATRLNNSFQLNRDRSNLIMKAIRGEYERQILDATKLVAISAGKYMLQAEEKLIELKVKIQEAPAYVLGNSNDLIRITDNLIGNGLRYVDPHGHIIVDAGAVEGFFQITIADDGRGIEKEDIERIWAMGWQAKDARQGSSGFGLSIARQIVQLHQGTINVFSEGRGKGTQFTVRIPLVDNPGKAEPDRNS
jgi:K+-sensing histidine kinase KdpD